MIPIKKAKEVFRESTVKNNSTEGFFNVFIFRRISICFSWILASLGINPNLITTVSFLLSVFSGYLLLIDFNANKILAIILFALAFILDMSDGEVARMTDKKSNFGAFYDPFLDRMVDIIFPFFVGVGFYISSYDKNILILLFLVIYLASRSGILFTENYLKSLGVNTSLESIREVVKSEKGFLSKYKKYLKWDGGFVIVLYTLGIFSNQIELLLIFISLFYLWILVVNFYNIKIAIKNINV